MPPLVQPLAAPLDYVPLSLLESQSSIKPTRWERPAGLKRATIAAIFFGCAAGVASIYPAAAAAIFVMVISVLIGDRLAARLNDHDDLLQTKEGRL